MTDQQPSAPVAIVDATTLAPAPSEGADFEPDPLAREMETQIGRKCGLSLAEREAWIMNRRRRDNAWLQRELSQISDRIETLSVAVDLKTGSQRQQVEQEVWNELWRVETLRTLLDARGRGDEVQLGPALMPPVRAERDGHGAPDVWLPRQEVVDCLQRGELGDAELFARLHGERLRYDHAAGAWYLWRGHVWARDQTEQVVRLVGDDLAAQYLATAALERKAGARSLADDLVARAKSLRARRRIMNVLALSQSQPDLALTGNEWDANPMLLACLNGVLDLRTGALRPGEPRDYIRTACPTEWRGLDCPAPRWEQFLREIFAGDEELIAFVQRLFGYALTGLATEHVFPVLWGSGRNGKESLLEAIKHVLGDLANPIPADVLLQTRRDPNSATPSLVALRGLRLAWLSESGEGCRLNVSQVKWLSGGGTIVARPLYGAPVTFRPQYVLMMITNHKPHASADDYALWQRVRLVPFTQAFVDNPSSPNEHPRDPSLGEKLKAESSGVLSWLVRGCLMWQETGLGLPNSVRDATRDYRRDEDEIQQFLEERTVSSPSTTTKASDLYESYRAWCQANGLAPMSGTSFGRRMIARGFPKTHTRGGAVYQGIGLLTTCP